MLRIFLHEHVTACAHTHAELYESLTTGAFNCVAMAIHVVFEENASLATCSIAYAHVVYRIKNKRRPEDNRHDMFEWRQYRLHATWLSLLR